MSNPLFTVYCSLPTVQCPLFCLSHPSSFILQPSSFRSPPFPKKINRNSMTGTKQLLGHFYRLLHLLRQMRTPCRPTPTNSTEKRSQPESITGNQPTGQHSIHPSPFILHPFDVRCERSSHQHPIARKLTATYSRSSPGAGCRRPVPACYNYAREASTIPTPVRIVNNAPD